MPAIFEYIAPISSDVSDNKSHTTKGLLILKECASGIPNGCEGMWNETLCGNDQYYAQPFIRGDKIYQQFHFDKSTYLQIQFFIVDCTTLEETPITAQECQTDDTKEDFQNLEIDTTSLPQCFFIKAKLFDCLGVPAISTSYIVDPGIIPGPVTLTFGFMSLTLPVVTLDPSDPAQAQIDFQTALSSLFPGFIAVVTWYLGPQTWQIFITTTTPGTIYIGETPNMIAFAHGKIISTTPGTFLKGGEEGECEEPVAEHCSEPYEEVRCDFPTLVLESTYPKADCFGNFYQDTQDCADNIFTNKYRIPGELIQDGYDFVQTKTADINVSVTQRRRYTLMLPKLPPYVADRIAMAFGGQEFTIDGVIYEGNIKFDKDFEFGRSWIIKTTLFRECTLDFGCE